MKNGNLVLDGVVTNLCSRSAFLPELPISPLAHFAISALTLMKDNLLSVSQAATLKGVSRSAIYAAVERGILPHQRVLGHIGVQESDVLAWTPIGHKAGRPKGKPMSEEAKRKISAGQKRRWVQRREHT